MLIPSVIFYLVIKFGIKSMLSSDMLIILTSIPVAGIIYIVGLIIMKEPMTMFGIEKIKDKIIQTKSCI